MKHVSTFICLATLLLFSVPVMSQTINEIPNADFEDWTGNAPTNYGAFQAPNGMFQTVFKSGNAPSGNSCLRIANASVMGQVIPGGLWYCKGDCSVPPKGMEGFNRSKFPVTKHYKTLCGYYKANLKGGDKIWISISMFKGNTNLGGSDAGKIQLAFITKSTSVWKKFMIPITYPVENATAIPDGAFLEIAIVKASFPKNPYQMQGTAGSEVYIDKLSFCKGKEDILVSLPENNNENIACGCNNDEQKPALDMKYTKLYTGHTTAIVNDISCCRIMTPQSGFLLLTRRMKPIWAQRIAG